MFDIFLQLLDLHVKISIALKEKRYEVSNSGKSPIASGKVVQMLINSQCLMHFPCSFIDLIMDF